MEIHHETPGDAVITAVCRAKAIDEAIIQEDGTIFVWAANAAEQIEAALQEAGWELVRLQDRH